MVNLKFLLLLAAILLVTSACSGADGSLEDTIGNNSTIWFLDPKSGELLASIDPGVGGSEFHFHLFEWEGFIVADGTNGLAVIKP